MLSNRDKQLKAERGYHGKSYVRPDGSECLLDKRDWELRKRELWERARQRCEFIYPGGERCGREGVIPAHIIPRHPLRMDNLWNLKLYCKYHDRLTEKQSWRRPRFGEKGPIVKRRANAV